MTALYNENISFRIIFTKDEGHDGAQMRKNVHFGVPLPIKNENT